MSCLFCGIASKEIPSDLVYEDERAVAFRDIHPQAPTHILIIPRKHLSSLAEAQDEDGDLLGHLLLIAAKLARQEEIDNDGFRTVINTNAGAGQTVFHLHVHLLGGRALTWPPG